MQNLLWQQRPCDEVEFVACLPLKFSPEETLSLQYGDVQTTPFLLHVKGMVTWRHFDLTCLDCTLQNKNHIHLIAVKLLFLIVRLL